MSSQAKQKEEAPRRELVPVQMQGGVLVPANLGEAIELAKLIAHSGMAPKAYEGNPGAVLIAVQMGAELGLSPMAAIQNIAVINGRPSLWGDAMLAIVMARRDCQGVVEYFDERSMAATCTVTRRGKPPVTRTFSQKDAETAGLWKKQGPWQQYPKRMLQMRARGFALRDSFPDALRGLNLAEESQDIEMGPAEWAEAPSPLQAGRHFGFGDRKSSTDLWKSSTPEPATEVQEATPPTMLEQVLAAMAKAETLTALKNAAQDGAWLERDEDKAAARMAYEQRKVELGGGK